MMIHHPHALLRYSVAILITGWVAQFWILTPAQFSKVPKHFASKRIGAIVVHKMERKSRFGLPCAYVQESFALDLHRIAISQYPLNGIEKLAAKIPVVQS